MFRHERGAGFGWPPLITAGELMTRTRKNGDRDLVRLSVRDWIGILGVLFAIMVTIFSATITLERRLTEVITRQEQLEIRIDRIEYQMDRGFPQ